MPRAFWVLSTTLLAACTSIPHDTSDPTDTSDTSDTATGGCPEGMSATTEAGMVFTVFRYNALTLRPVFVDGMTTDADGAPRPAGCIAADGKSVDFQFQVGDDTLGRIAVEAPSGDQSYDLNGTLATVMIDLFGADGSPTFTNGDWVSGTWYVSTVGSVFDTDLNGSAVQGDGVDSFSLAINFTLQARR